MLVKALAVVLFLVCSLPAQTTVTINDSNGNQATAAVYNGNLYYHDSKGNFATGTLRDGRVFVNANNGETVFGTMKNGSVFLTDKKGTTTGTIQNGNIFLNNSNGSVTTGTYDKRGSTYMNTTPPAPTSTPSNDPELQQRIAEQQQQAYAAGYAIGYGVTAAIESAVDHHKLKSFCKANPTAIYQEKDRVRIPCQEAPVTDKAQKAIDSFCRDHPFREINYGLRTITCDTPPNPGNLVWATAYMEFGAKAYKIYSKKKDVKMTQVAVDGFNDGEKEYCILTGKGAAYSDLQGNEQHCE